MSASRPADGQHLDATAGREVVFCHACSFEWYCDEQGLECPRCHSEITEVIDPAEDPRDLSRPVPNPDDYPSSASTSPERHPRRQDGDSDPEEADIEDLVGPHGFHYHRSTPAPPSLLPLDLPSRDQHHQRRYGAHGHSHDEQHHHRLHHEFPPVDPILARFTDMIQGFGASARPGGHNYFGGTGHTVHRTTYTTRTMGGGTTSVTIVSGPGPILRREDPEADPFQQFFSNTLRDLGPPSEGGANNDRRAPMAFSQGLRDLFSLFDPSQATSGDAVYTQEALDRIITSLMEQNPQSNAPPPASTEAIDKLEQKGITKDMLEAHPSCAICLSDFEEGNVILVLPCKHVFHPECVKPWLQINHTCPTCRTPIERSAQQNAGEGGNGEGGNGEGSANATGSGTGSGAPDNSSSHGGHSDAHAPQDHSNPFGTDSNGNPGTRFEDGSVWRSFRASPHGPDARVMLYRFETGSSPRRPRPLSRPPSQSQTPLNQVMRDIASLQREQQRTRDREHSSEQSYDTSRFQQRRTSLSPTAPRAYTPAEAGARMRQRSPPSSERRRSPPESENSGRSSSGGPFGWLRDRLGGSQRDGRGS